MIRIASKFHSVTGLIRTPVLAAVLAIGFLVSSVHVPDAQAGSGGNIKSQTLKKHSGGNSRSFHVSGENLSLRPVSGYTGKVTQRRLGSHDSNSGRVYHHKRSVLDGHYGDVHQRRLHGGRFDNVRRYGKIEYDASSESRSGVVYRSMLHSRKGYHGLKEIAGNSGQVVSRRLVDDRQKHHHHGEGRFTKGELIVIGAAVNSYYEIAGGETSATRSIQEDCAYQTYCTIDLGGPKIITFNDAGDIENGELVEEGIAK